MPSEHSEIVLEENHDFVVRNLAKCTQGWIATVAARAVAASAATDQFILTAFRGTTALVSGRHASVEWSDVWRSERPKGDDGACRAAVMLRLLRY